MDKIRSIFQRVVWFASNSVQSLDRILNRHSGCLFCLLHPWTQSKLEIGSSILCWFGPPIKSTWLGLFLTLTYLPITSIHTFFNWPPSSLASPLHQNFCNRWQKSISTLQSSIGCIGIPSSFFSFSEIDCLMLVVINSMPH